MFAKLSVVALFAIVGVCMSQLMDPNVQVAGDALINTAGGVYKTANGLFDNLAGTSLSLTNSVPIAGPLASPWLNLLFQWLHEAGNLGEALTVDAGRTVLGETGSDQMH